MSLASNVLLVELFPLGLAGELGTVLRKLAHQGYDLILLGQKYTTLPRPAVTHLSTQHQQFPEHHAKETRDRGHRASPGELASVRDVRWC